MISLAYDLILLLAKHAAIWANAWGCLCGSLQKDVTYNGWDVFYFYTHMFRNYFAGYPWQVKTSYAIVVFCIVMTVVIYLLFVRDLILQSREKKRERKVHEKYSDAVRTILGNDTLMASDMEELLGDDEAHLRKINPKYFVSLLAKERMEMYEVVYLPNLQSLANMLGVREYMEMNLLRQRDVFQTLQVLLLFQLTITEGRLANYVNSGDAEVRMLARLCFILCSKDEPYHYLIPELNAPESLMRTMLLHYVFGWMKAQDRRMPSFLLLANRIDNEPMAAFMVREVAYWGTDVEKTDVTQFFNSEKIECRTAAVNVVTLLSDGRAEEQIIESYWHQPEHIRREMLKALLSIKSGKQLDFFNKVYHTTNSRETKEIALSCMYNYSNAGRRAFEELRMQADDDDRSLINQVDSNNLLMQIRTFSFN